MILAVVVLSLLLTQKLQAQACEITASELNFGAYSSDSFSDLESTGTITISCSNLISLLVSYSVSLSTGSSGSFISRKMAAGPYELNYQLYADAGRTMVWGDGSGGTATVDGSILLQAVVPADDELIIYSRLPALQEAAPGNYSDTITVTVNF